MIIRRICLLMTLALLPLALTSCSGGGEGGERVDVYPVRGKVTLDGSPLPGATVMFSPVDTKTGPVATARTNDAGEYQLTTYEGGDGAAAGDYIVLVTKSDAGSGGGPESSHEQYSPSGSMHAGKAGAKDSGSTLPKKYASKDSSDLRATVKPEDNEGVNFDLSL